MLICVKNSLMHREKVPKLRYYFIFGFYFLVEIIRNCIIDCISFDNIKILKFTCFHRQIKNERKRYKKRKRKRKQRTLL